MLKNSTNVLNLSTHFWEICTESEYFALKVRIFVHAEFLSTKILNFSPNYLNNSLCVVTFIIERIKNISNQDLIEGQNVR